MDREELLRSARNLYENPGTNEALKVVLEDTYPELKESEDERIRKYIQHELACLRASEGKGSERYNELSSAIAWLEKQKEQKPTASWTIQDARPGDILNSARVQATIIFKGFNPDGKHIDAYCALQKGLFIAQELPWDRDFEPATQVWKDTLFDAMARKGYLWDAENKRLNKAVQKPAQCIEDSVKFKEGFKAGRESGLRDGQKYVLDNLDSYGLCKLAEWSEEDAAMLESIIKDYDYLSRIWLQDYEKRLGGADCEARIDIRNQITWLKSLRPQPHWKPSDEQMEWLESAVRLSTDKPRIHGIIISLYEQLKRLSL